MGGLSALAELPKNKGGQAAHGTRSRGSHFFNGLNSCIFGYV
jgi:hypothetical protein